MDGVRVGVDVGGTFTDLVALGADGVVTAKVPSTPRDQAEGVMRSLGVSGVGAGAVAALAHGTTVATNALLERRGARAALVTTEGFRDLIEIGRQDRPSLYDLTLNRPPPLVPRELRHTVRERMGPEGVVLPLDEGCVRAVASELRAAEVEAVAVCLLFGYLHPEHEQRVGELLRAALPGVRVSLSCEVLPEFREYERSSTTAADAYLGPGLGAHLRNLEERARGAGLPSPLVMLGSGGVLPIAAAARQAAACALSGPAGGVVGAAYVAGLSGYDDVLTFDMGGTSTDVAPVLGGEARTTTEAQVGGVPIRLPMVDVHTVSAGGGSVAWADAGGALRVGPRSAGAEPGPAAYGAGGHEPTVTDANLCLGLLADGARLGGEVTLRRDLAERAVARLGRELGLGVAAAAEGIVQVANAEMARALRVVSVRRGLDPRAFALVAFGGAGPLHACALARELGMRTVLVPRACGVLSALGLAISDLRRDYARPRRLALDDLVPPELEAEFGELEAEAARDLPSPVCRRRADLRYRGQGFELPVEADDLGALAERFHREHARRYGYSMPGEAVELVSLRLVASAPRSRPPLREGPPRGEARVGSRVASFEGETRPVLVYDRTRMGAGSEARGPALVEFPEAACAVPPGWRGVVDAAGTLVLEREA
jgi:N-methylhydantoinase A